MDILKIEPNEDDEYLEDAELEAEYEEEEAGLVQESLLTRFTKHKSFKAAVAVVSIYTLVLIGDTIGALVSLNGSKPLEYGQGVTTTVSCDTDGLQVTAIGRTDSPTGNISFLLDGFKVTGISDKCINTFFKIGLYDANGTAVNLGYKNLTGTPATGDDATYAKLSISRDTVDAPGLDWRVFPTTQMPSPLSEDGLTICGGEADLSDEINYDYGFGIPKFECPVDNFLTHWRGYITVPGTNNGKEQRVNFDLTLTDQAVMIIGNDKVFDVRAGGTEKVFSDSANLLKNTAYPFDLWVFSATGSHKVKLDWDATAGSLVPSTAFQWDSSLAVKISPEEGSTDYTVSSTSSTKDNRNFVIKFNRPIPTDVPKRFTIETSRS